MIMQWTLPVDPIAVKCPRRWCTTFPRDVSFSQAFKACIVSLRRSPSSLMWPRKPMTWSTPTPDSASQTWKRRGSSSRRWAQAAGTSTPSTRWPWLILRTAHGVPLEMRRPKCRGTGQYPSHGPPRPPSSAPRLIQSIASARTSATGRRLGSAAARQPHPLPSARVPSFDAKGFSPHSRSQLHGLQTPAQYRTDPTRGRCADRVPVAVDPAQVGPDPEHRGHRGPSLPDPPRSRTRSCRTRSCRWNRTMKPWQSAPCSGVSMMASPVR